MTFEADGIQLHAIYDSVHCNTPTECVIEFYEQKKTVVTYEPERYNRYGNLANPGKVTLVGTFRCVTCGKMFKYNQTCQTDGPRNPKLSVQEILEENDNA